MEKIIETKICGKCGNTFHITDKDREFYEKVAPVFNGERFTFPSPKLCFECRRRRRKAFRNEGKLYKRKCDASGKDIISIYSEDKKYIVYSNDYWWKHYITPEKGVEIHLDTTFFELFEKLMYVTPFIASYVNESSVNSQFGNHTGDMKDCYLTFGAWASERVLYGCHFNGLQDCIDVQGCLTVQNSYQVIGCESCYHIHYSMNCSNCSNSAFLFDCQNCEHCFLCYNLRGKKYCIENIQYSEKEYREKLESIKKETYIQGWKALETTIEKAVKRNMVQFSCENAYGDTLKSVYNCYETYFMEEARDCKYIENGAGGTKDTYDGYGIGVNLELGYEIVDTGANATKVAFTVVSHGCSNSYYLMNCYNSSYLFGCIGLRNKQYCILNKQYTKEEYEKLVPKLIHHMQMTGEWGEFFPAKLSQFGYNESVALDYSPLTKEQALSFGFNWSDYEAQFPKVEKIIRADQLPNDISKIPDDILNWAIECEVTKKPFRIIKQELEFYRKHNIPVPHIHPDTRHIERLHMRNPRKLFEGKCEKCGEDMVTTYPPEKKVTKIYCESCYNTEIY